MTEFNPVFAWPRFWISADGDASTFYQRGYLTLPAADHRDYYDFVPSQLSELEETPVLILLGDPGCGKSQSLADERRRLATDRPDDIVVFCDLKDYGAGSQEELRDILFNKDGQFLSAPQRRWWILLDGLDECGMHAPTEWLIRNLVTKIDHPERVSIRIACRASSWSATLQETLQTRWQSTGDSPVKCLRLCPLRAEDVHMAAQTLGLDGDEYLRAVEGRQAEELAGLPVTCKFMLELYREGKLPQRRTEIYEQGLRLLCEDSPSRRAQRNAGTVSAERRFVAVARLAVGYILGGHNGIWNGPAGLCPTTFFAARDTKGKHTHVQYEVDDLVISEALVLTGLFTRLSEDSYGFISRTFAEFLAAWSLANSKVSVPQKLKLVLHPEAGRLIRDLYDTVAWAAAMDVEFLSWLVENEPYAALDADLLTLSTGDLPMLVSGLLNVAERKRDIPMIVSISPN